MKKRGLDVIVPLRKHQIEKGIEATDIYIHYQPTNKQLKNA